MPGSVPSPNLTLTITPPGGTATDYTAYLSYTGASGQITISQQFGRQGDTAVIVLVDDWQGLANPRFVVKTLSRVLFYDNAAAATLFAGVITNPVLAVTGPNRNEWTLNCTDYTCYADNANVQGNFSGLTIDQAVVSLTAQANCGVTAATTLSGGFIAPAPSIAEVSFNWVKLSDAWRRLAQLASSVTPYGWYVDQNLALHFFDATTAISSGATFTTTPTASAVNGSYTEGHISLDSQAGYEWDGTSIRNRIIVQGATQTITTSLTGPPTDTWQADGVQTSWPLRYTVTGSPTLTVGGASTPVTVVGAGGSSSTAWTIQPNSIGQYFLTATTAPPAGVVLKIWYDYQVPVVAQANDYPSQTTYTGPNGGVYAEYISDSSLTTTSMALARAQRERTEYGFAAERVTFTTTEDFLGWVRAGETFTFASTLIPDSQASYSWGLTATFLCISNSVTFGTGGYRTMTVTGVRI